MSDMDMARLRETVANWSHLQNVGPAHALQVHRDQAVVLLLIGTGISIKELCELGASDVRKDRADHFYISVHHHKRQIPLESDALKAVNRWLVLRHLVYRGKTYQALFTTRKHERITSMGVQTILERLRVGSGVAFDPFALRHTFIRRKVQQGYSHLEISAMLGRPSHDIIRMYEVNE